MKINWKKKLTDRKFWAAVIGFITPTLLAFGVAHQTVTQVAAIVMAGATVVSYIIGEGMSNSGSKGGNDDDKDE